ncbi:MFS transporter [Roseomonas sp. BN140053]|uniref:MFS transporter n=1 Tax=Roseomonas sp. BN140053 TaxID=3391898 RepID=UPI0039E8DCF1
MNRVALLVAATLFMEFLDGTVIVTALPQMAQSLNTTAVDLHAGISAYLLTVAVFILPSGWLATRFGARPVFTAAILLFTASSVLCGLANSVESFIAARVLQGVGGAMMVPVGRLVVLRTTAKQDLMRAMAVLTWPALTAPILGPPLGGFIAEYASWRWIFLINVPIGLVGTLLAWRMIPEIARQPRKPFDGLGFLLGALLCIGAMLSLDLLGSGEDSSWRLGLLVLGTVALGFALRHHLRRHPHPLIDFSALQVATFRITFLGGTAMRVLISTMPFLLPLFFQLGFGLDPFHAGLLVLPLFIGNIGMKPLTSPILRRWGFRTVLVANGLVQAATMLGCVALSPAMPVPAIVALLVVSGASRSLQFTALNTLAFADVPEPWMPGANTLFSIAFQFGLGFGVAVGAVSLRLSGLATGHWDGTPGLEDFHVAFAALAILTVAAALDGLRLAREAGHVVSGRPAPGR